MRLVNDQDVGFRSAGPCGETARMMYDAAYPIPIPESETPFFATCVVVLLIGLAVVIPILFL